MSLQSHLFSCNHGLPPKHIGTFGAHVSGRRPWTSKARFMCQSHPKPKPFQARNQRYIVKAVTAEPKPTAELQVIEELQPNCVVKLTVTVPPHLCQKAFRSVVDHGKDIELTGFRKGKKSKNKLPEAMLVKILGGEKKVKAAAVEEVLLSTLPQALDKYGERAIEGSEAVLSTADDMIASFDVQSGMQYVCSVQMKPEVSWKGSYQGLEVTVESAGDDSSVSGLIQQELQKERRQSSTLRVVADRGLMRGDVAIVDVIGVAEGVEGAKEEVTHRKSMQLDTEDADRTFLPGIVDALSGMRCGEMRDVSLAVPQDYSVEAWRGKMLDVSVTVVELFSRQLPELDDAWAASVFPGCDLHTLAQQLTEVALKGAQQENDRRVREALLNALCGLVEVDVPPHLVRVYGETEYQAMLAEQMSEGSLTYDEAVALATEEEMDKFIESRYHDLQNSVRKSLAVDAIFEKEDLSVDENELEQEMATTVDEFKRQEMEFDMDRLREQVEETLKAQAVLSWLQSQTTIHMLPPAVTIA